ncbi:hypothetical protein RHMOL_Rhmol07G0306000 [Rhododendron molle]|uniref:Uncharacterized protein n=1 Tax=Rhododendron molle TaxID=49168 RepID=A0ACC0N863_RHOML|nr:hypothetical protein RHMOL_Rhmol07G0306000 [Rhododendron molle]
MEATASKFKIILGSSSVHRQKVLAEMGYDFTIMTADIDEKSIRRDTPEEMVMAIAEAKDVVAFSSLGVVEEVLLLVLLVVTPSLGRTQPQKLAIEAEAIIAKLPIDYCKQDAELPLLITGDQVVVYEGKVREKPSSKEEARQFIKVLRIHSTGYSSGTAGTVSSVLVTNLKTGLRKGDWEKAEIHFHAIPDQVVDDLVGTTESMMGLPKALTERLILEAH